MTAVVAKGEPVAISGFAKFVKVDRPSRMGRNPATGEAIRIKASKKARITPVKAFKDAVLAPTRHPSSGRVRSRPMPRPWRRWQVGCSGGGQEGAGAEGSGRKAPAKKAPAKRTTTARKAPAKRAAGQADCEEVVLMAGHSGGRPSLTSFHPKPHR